VPRRMSVPGPDDIFRPTAVPQPPVVELKKAEAETQPPSPRTSSGRVRHDEKMTVYVTSDELLDIEHARLDLRRHHGLGVDRGRIVRAAVALALEELDENGAESQLLARLRGE
jgi:hypothetical protein